MPEKPRPPVAPPKSRILFIARATNLTGLLTALGERAEGWFCPLKRDHPAPAGMKILTLKAAFELRKALRAGRYDLVISFDNPQALWKHDKGWISNLLTSFKRIVRKPHTLGTYLVPWILAGSDVPLAVIDWDDNTMISTKNWALLDRATCYFKTQTPRNPYKAFLFQDSRSDCLFNIIRQSRNRERALKLRPFSIGITLPEEATAAPVEKTTDLFFAGALYYSWARQEGIRHLEELRDEGYKIDLFFSNVGKGLPQADFLHRCAQAWLVWSPEGAGWDCSRHYTAPLLGSVPILNDPDTRRHQPLKEGVDAFYYQVEGDDLKRAVRMALKDKPRLRQMAAAGAEHVRRHHTHAALADYVIAETLRTAREGYNATPLDTDLAPSGQETLRS